MECIKISDLTFGYNSDVIFNNLNLTLKSGKRYVIAGLNGCGKSTLLKIIGGKVLAESNSVFVYGKDPFRDTITNSYLTFIDNEWGMRTVAYCGYNLPLQSSIKVKEMMKNIKQLYPERNEELLKVLNINEDWKLNCVSEGQRKRVQIYLNLIQPFKICLLDEITVNLDILIKHKFMEYLKKESQVNNACIIYVTHIFDGLDSWTTDLIYIKQNRDMIQIDDLNKIKPNNIYEFLLENFKNEDSSKNYNEKEENPRELNLSNAGGYSDGVLVNLKN
tara:strand:- start:15 stop:842 length:828 start_codon:yes stop_codon:yes gene_type:complete